MRRSKIILLIILLAGFTPQSFGQNQNSLSRIFKEIEDQIMIDPDSTTKKFMIHDSLVSQKYYEYTYVKGKDGWEWVSRVILDPSVPWESLNHIQTFILKNSKLLYLTEKWERLGDTINPIIIQGWFLIENGNIVSSKINGKWPVYATISTSRYLESETTLNRDFRRHRERMGKAIEDWRKAFLRSFNPLVFQTSLYSIKTIEKSKEVYVDYIMKKDRVYSVTKSGKIRIWNYSEGTLIQELEHQDSIIGIGFDKKESLHFITDQNKIYRFTENFTSIKKISELKTHIHHILFDELNELIAVTDVGITYPRRNKTYYPDTTKNIFPYRWKPKPTILFDDDGKVWIGFNYGEWGGNLNVFDSRKKILYIRTSLFSIYLQLYQLPIKRILPLSVQG